MGKSKAIIPFLLAIVVAAAASLVVYRWVQTKTAIPAPKAVFEDKVEVALAGTDLPWGTKLTTEMIKTVSFPKQAVSPGHFNNAASINGRVLIAPLKQNEPILESKLAPTSVTTGGVHAVVSPGKRAIAVAGDKVIGLAGFIQPGNHVDVLVTLRGAEGEKGAITKIVLENVLVLATGTQIQHNADGKPAPVDVFTVEVTPEEAERISLTATQGKLHFALRNVLDREVVYTLGSTVPDALDSYKPRLQLVKEQVVPVVSEVKEQTRRAFEVQTIRGNKVSKQTF